MERWEPPKPTSESVPRRRRAQVKPDRQPRDVPETWLVIGLRIGIAVFLSFGVFFQPFRDQLHLIIPVFIAGMLFLLYQAQQADSTLLRNHIIVDMGLFVTLIPASILYGFVATFPGDLGANQTSAFLQVFVGLILAGSLATGLAWLMLGDDRVVMTIAIMPAWVGIIALNFVLHDYRNQTVLAVIAVCYVMSAVAAGISALMYEPLRRYTAAMFYGGTLFLGLLALDPGLSTLHERATLIVVFTWLLMLAGLALMILLPNPGINIAGLARALAPNPNRRHVRPRRQDDPRRDPSERS